MWHEPVKYELSWFAVQRGTIASYACQARLMLIAERRVHLVYSGH